MSQPKYLGQQSNVPTTVLDVIPWPSDVALAVTLDASEFTSLCPVTAQPDFGRVVISYVPRASLVETKSLKLYLWTFRERAAFVEHAVAEIAREFFAQVKPRTVTVSGHFHSRGGIEVRPVVTITEPMKATT